MKTKRFRAIYTCTECQNWSLRWMCPCRACGCQDIQHGAARLRLSGTWWKPWAWTVHLEDVR